MELPLIETGKTMGGAGSEGDTRSLFGDRLSSGSPQDIWWRREVRFRDEVGKETKTMSELADI